MADQADNLIGFQEESNHEHMISFNEASRGKRPKVTIISYVNIYVARCGEGSFNSEETGSLSPEAYSLLALGGSKEKRRDFVGEVS
ncbi:MAG: hypothetical protein ACK2T1_13890 [Candidatus Promineifilaceae bacterium]|jgi:hypothetical protein